MRLTAKSSKARIDIFRAKEDAPILTVNAPPDGRPFIHPWLAQDGVGSLTENEPAHHAWQHGLYTGLNDVNGIGFWTEGLTGNPMDGTIHSRPLAKAKYWGRSANWEVEADWKAPSGEVILTETQSCSITDWDDTMLLVFVWTLEAAIDIHLGKSSYGGLFLRMPWRKESGGEVLTSEGATTYQEADGQRARWVAISMPLLGRDAPAGVAFCDDSINHGFPAHWRVDGELGIGPSRSIPGPWSLTAGETYRAAYGLIAFNGPINREAIETVWKEYNP